MPKSHKLTVYLAGPVSNCNQRQRSQWRKELKARLASQYVCIDPADHTVGWTPFKEMLEIDRSDIVVANLWRESIGTVVGIVQARRKGKPVILIDPNYLDSLVLKTVVGPDAVVHSIEGAAHKLEHEVAPQLAEDVKVRKKSGDIEPFKLAKLHDALNAACAKARIEDAVLPDLVAREVHTAVRSAARNGIIDSAQITRFVFDQLGQLSKRSDPQDEDDLSGRARGLKEAWQHYQEFKHEQRLLEKLAETERERTEKLNQLELENELLKRRLRASDAQLSAVMSAESKTFKDLRVAVKKAEHDFGEWLTFHERAFRSAADSPYVHPEKAYYALSLLAQYAEERQANTRLPLDAWLRGRGCPFEFAPNESESTRNNLEHQAQRTIHHAGRPMVLKKHLKLGTGDANTCCRLYFEIDAGRILIGYVGRHLQTGQD